MIGAAFTRSLHAVLCELRVLLAASNPSSQGDVVLDKLGLRFGHATQRGLQHCLNLASNTLCLTDLLNVLLLEA